MRSRWTVKCGSQREKGTFFFLGRGSRVPGSIPEGVGLRSHRIRARGGAPRTVPSKTRTYPFSVPVNSSRVSEGPPCSPQPQLGSRVGMGKGEPFTVDEVPCVVYANTAGDPESVKIGVGCGVPKKLQYTFFVKAGQDYRMMAEAERGNSRFIAVANNIAARSSADDSNAFTASGGSRCCIIKSPLAVGTYLLRPRRAALDACVRVPTCHRRSIRRINDACSAIVL